MTISRRNALLTALFGAGGLGLRALATGLPAALLANPRRAFAGPACAWAGNAQFLILSTSGNGDPLNGNVPGTYAADNAPGSTVDFTDIVHPMAPLMAPTQFTLGSGGPSVTAAKPWSTLTSLGRTSFFHCATETPIHPDETKVLGLMGTVYNAENNPDMLVSALAEQLGPCLGTIQNQPVSVGASSPAEALSFQGRVQPILTPVGLKAILTQPTGALTNLQSLRDQSLDQLNAIYRETGNAAQKAFIDRYVNSQAQVRELPGMLLTALSALTDNSPVSQITAAVALIQMKVSPVITLHFPFGGDNHTDTDLATETTQQVGAAPTTGNANNIGGVTAINQLLAALAAASPSLVDQVTFASLNVFGRTMSVQHKQYAGRDHNQNHHVGIMIGKGVKGSVIGGIQAVKGNAKSYDYGALPINSSTGAGDINGDITPTNTLGAFGQTLGAALGVPEATLTTMFSGANPGKIVKAALAT